MSSRGFDRQKKGSLPIYTTTKRWTLERLRGYGRTKAEAELLHVLDDFTTSPISFIYLIPDR